MHESMLSPDIRKLLLAAPDGQLDACMKPLIEKWNDIPTALQILEVVDQCIYAALASGFTLTIMQSMLAEAIQKEGTTHEELVKLATWRNRT